MKTAESRFPGSSNDALSCRSGSLAVRENASVAVVVAVLLTFLLSLLEDDLARDSLELGELASPRILSDGAVGRIAQGGARGVGGGGSAGSARSNCGASVAERDAAGAAGRVGAAYSAACGVCGSRSRDSVVLDTVSTSSI